MNSDALITMLAVQIPVITITIYFFWKVLKTPEKEEPDSFTDNDPK
jgi:heme/copper-type cytochrome/quinol oxidase subunit 2